MGDSLLNDWQLPFVGKRQVVRPPGTGKPAKVYKGWGEEMAFPVKISLDFQERACYNFKLRRCILRLVEKWVENSAFHWDI